VSIYLVYIKREEIFAKVNYYLSWEFPFCFWALLCFWRISVGRAAGSKQLRVSYRLFYLHFINGAFILLTVCRLIEALVPLLFLIFTFDPTALMDNIIRFLQVGFHGVCKSVILASGVPFLRDGFVFQLPNISVEVAKQCSGIRSGMAIFIVAILAGYMFLKSLSGK